MGIVLKILGIGYMCMAVLWFVSYLPSLKKREWISYYDEEDLKLMPECANKGYYKKYYTFVGAVIKSIGFGGIIAFILIATDGLFFMRGISWGIMGLLDIDLGWAVVLLCSVVASIWYYRRIEDEIVW